MIEDCVTILSSLLVPFLKVGGLLLGLYLVHFVARLLVRFIREICR